MKHRDLLTTMALLSLLESPLDSRIAISVPPHHRRNYTEATPLRIPPAPLQLTEADERKLAAAEAKRQRKLAKRLRTQERDA